MTAIRISAHKLEIETGRYLSKNRADRFCTLCYDNGNKVMGDEEHAIMSCPSFDVEREALMKFIGSKYPNFKVLSKYSKMFFMLTCEDECAIKTAKFLQKIYSFQRPRFNKSMV